MKALAANMGSWCAGSALALAGAAEVRLVAYFSAPAWLGGLGFLAAGLGLAWIAVSVGRRVRSEQVCGEERQ